MSDAELTVKHAIFSGIVDQWHKKNEQNFAELIKDNIFENLFAPHLIWAVKEYLHELKQNKK